MPTEIACALALVVTQREPKIGMMLIQRDASPLERGEAGQTH